MNKIQLMMMLLIMGVVSCDKEEDNVSPTNKENSNPVAELTVEKKQNAFLGYVGATWCPPCGTHGGPAFKKIKDQFNNNELLPIYFSPSGGTMPYYIENSQALPSPMVDDFYAALKSTGGIPFFNINGNNEGGTFGSIDATADRYKPLLDNSIDTISKVGIAVRKTLTKDKLNCEVKVKLFEQFNGELYYCVLALEEKLIGRQSLSPTELVRNYEHQNITRASLIGDGTMKGQKAFELFASGISMSGEEFTQTFSLDFEDLVLPSSALDKWNYDPNNTQIVAMVWTKSPSSGDWEYLNGTMAE